MSLGCSRGWIWVVSQRARSRFSARTDFVRAESLRSWYEGRAGLGALAKPTLQIPDIRPRPLGWSEMASTMIPIRNRRCQLAASPGPQARPGPTLDDGRWCGARAEADSRWSGGWVGGPFRPCPPERRCQGNPWGIPNGSFRSGRSDQRNHEAHGSLLTNSLPLLSPIQLHFCFVRLPLSRTKALATRV